MDFLFNKLNEKYYSRNAKLYLLTVIFFYISMGAFNMLQGIYIKELKMGEDFLGAIIGIRTFAVAIAAFPCAFIVNRIGKKKSIFLAIMFMCITTICQGYFRNGWLILFFATIQGIFNGLLIVTEAPFLMENSSGEGKIKIFSYTFSFNMFATMIGYFAFGHIVEVMSKKTNLVQANSYAIMAAGLLGCISLKFVHMMDEDVSSTNSHDSIFTMVSNFKKIFKQRNVMHFLNYNFIIGFGAGLVVPYFNVYLKYKINIDTAILGTIMSLSTLAMGLGGLCTPILAKKFGKVKTIIICQVVSIPFLLLIATPPSIIIVSIAFFMRSALMNMAGPVIGNMSMELVAVENRSILSSLMNLSSNLSRAIAVAIAGFIMKNFSNGYEIPYYITTALYILGTVYFYVSFKKYDKLNIKDRGGIQFGIK